MTHLEKARGYIARGEEFYRRAAEEIVAAMAEDSTLSYRAVASHLDRSHAWVQDIVRWHTNGKSTRDNRESAPTPYAEQSGAVAKRHARSVLSKATAADLKEALPQDEDQLARIADAAYQRLSEKRSEQRETARANRRAVRSERVVEPDATPYRMVMVEFGRVSEALSSVTRIAAETTWSEERSERLVRMLGKLRGLVDLAEESIMQEREIDWDAALADLVEAE